MRPESVPAEQREAGLFSAGFCGERWPNTVRSPKSEKRASETLVVDAPHMHRRIELEYEPVWEGDRGHIHVTDARLE